jgi:hypothetical protein
MTVNYHHGPIHDLHGDVYGTSEAAAGHCGLRCTRGRSTGDPARRTTEALSWQQRVRCCTDRSRPWKPSPPRGGRGEVPKKKTCFDRLGYPCPVAHTDPGGARHWTQKRGGCGATVEADHSGLIQFVTGVRWLWCNECCGGVGRPSECRAVVNGWLLDNQCPCWCSHSLSLSFLAAGGGYPPPHSMVTLPVAVALEHALAGTRVAHTRREIGRRMLC